MNRQTDFSRKGYRAEKLGEYFLSEFAAITPVARPDDFGIDCYCALLSSEKADRCVYGGKIFGVQIKSGFEPELAVGGLGVEKRNSKKPLKSKKNWREHEVHWLMHLNIPYFLAVIDLDEGKMSLYSTSHIWCLRWLIGSPFKIILKPSQQTNLNVDFTKNDWLDNWIDGLLEGKQLTEPCKEIHEGKEVTIHDGKEWIVRLGRPIIEVSKKHDDSRPDTKAIREAIKWWVLLEQENQLYQSLNIPFCWGCKTWETNKRPCDQDRLPLHFGNPTKGQNIAPILKALQPGIIALAFNFLKQEDVQISSLKGIINLSKGSGCDVKFLEEWIQKVEQNAAIKSPLE